MPAREEGCAPLGEIVERLKREYGAVELPEERIPSLKWVHKFNALHMPENQERLHLAEDQLHIRALQFPQELDIAAAREIVKTTWYTLPLKSR